jgi:hypothetical protein
MIEAAMLAPMAEGQRAAGLREACDTWLTGMQSPEDEERGMAMRLHLAPGMAPSAAVDAHAPMRRMPRANAPGITVSERQEHQNGPQRQRDVVELEERVLEHTTADG